MDLPATGEEKGIVLLVHGFASTATMNWVGTGWTQALCEAGYRVIALDNRGHGASQKFYTPEDYGPDIFARDAFELLDHLDIGTVLLMGYSMGARISCWMLHAQPERISRAVFGGMGEHIFGGRGGYEKIAAALEADDPSTIADPVALSFRKFADSTGSDRKALAACIRPARTQITPDIVKGISKPVLVAVGGRDDIAGSPQILADMMPEGEAFVIDNLDHLKATGAASYKQRVLEFFDGEN